MDLFEYQGKSLYQDYDISHPKSSLVKDPKELQETLKERPGRKTRKKDLEERRSP